MAISSRLLPTYDWSFTHAITDQHVHRIHPYPARFIPQIPATILEHLSRPGETVLDTFCGSGTTLVESSLVGRNSIGIDINPLAVLISKVKTTPLTPYQSSQLDEWISTLDSLSNENVQQHTLFEPLYAPIEPLIPNIPNIDNWFEPFVKTELGSLISRINQINDADIRDVCRVALAAIIVGVSNQDSETRYTKRQKLIQPGHTIARFKNKIVDIRSRLDEYNRLRNIARPVITQTICGDMRNISIIDNKSVHLVVTSPPYPNAFDYHLYHRFRLFWLGFDPVAMARNEIGSHLNYQRNGKSIEDYTRDMSQCFSHINRLLISRRHCCVIIGDSVFKGELIKNDEVIIQIAQQRGFALEHNIKRTLPSIKRSFSTPARRLKEESIVILRKVDETDV